MKCLKCEKESVKNGNGFCRDHFIEDREKVYLDNTDINNLGIIKWAKDMIPDYVIDITPEFHKMIYYYFLMLYNSFYKNKYERLLELISFRGSAKSTILTMIIPSYIIAHNNMDMLLTINNEVVKCRIQEGFIVIISETGTMAEDFTVRIRDEFTVNPRLRYFYKSNIANAIDAIDGQWTRRAFKINGLYVLGVGIGMQIRGRIKGANRVTLMLGDDLYSENNVKTVDGRKHVRSWWNGAAVNSIDDVRGKAILTGTILHEDTILIDLKRNPLWKTVEFCLMPLELFKEFVSKHMKSDENNGTCTLPFDDIKNETERLSKQRKYYDEVQKSQDWKLAWSERADLYFLALKYKEAMVNRQVSLLYQEYFHVIVSEEQKRFKPQYFQPLEWWRVEYKYGYNWFYSNLYTNPDGTPKPMAINIEFGLDTADGLIDGDDSVITVRGALPDMRRVTLYQAIGKFSERDTLLEEKPDDKRYLKVVTDRSFIKKIGYIDETFRLAMQYHPSKIKIGVGARESKIVSQMRLVFRANNSSIMIFPRPQTIREKDKATRISDGLLPGYQTMMNFHANGLSKLEGQLEFLGSSKYDDCADSLEVAEHNISVPHEIDYNMFEDVSSQYSDMDIVRGKVKFERKGTTNYNEDNFDWRVN